MAAEEETFEARKKRLVSEYESSRKKTDEKPSVPPSVQENPQQGSGFYDVTPSKEGVRKAIQFGVPFVAAAATAPLTAGMSLPAIYGTEALASLGAEGALQLSGISDRDPMQLLTAAAAPGAGRLAHTGLAQIPRLIPGFGKAAQASLTPMAREIPKTLLSGESSEQLFKDLHPEALKTVIPKFPELAKTIKDLGEEGMSIVPIDQLRQELKGTKVQALFQDIEDVLAGTPAKVEKKRPTIAGKPESKPTGLPSQSVTTPARRPGMTLEEAQASVAGFGKIIRGTTDPALRSNYKQLYKAMLTDLENAPMASGEAVSQWQAARQAYKREKASFLLSEQVEKSISSKEGVEFINADSVLKWLRTNNDVKSRVSEKEYSGLVSAFKNMSKMEGHNMSKFMGLLAGAAISGSPAGALTGYVAAENLSRALLTDVGRKMVHQMIKNPNQSMFRRAGAVMGAAAHGFFDQPGPLLQE